MAGLHGGVMCIVEYSAELRPGGGIFWQVKKGEGGDRATGNRDMG